MCFFKKRKWQELCLAICIKEGKEEHKKTCPTPHKDKPQRNRNCNKNPLSRYIVFKLTVDR